MKFTLSWLKAPLDTDADANTIADKLTSIGLEVESVEDAGARLKDFTVAYVISAEKHPNADKLKLCMVDTGAGEPVQVVCGAPNAHTGMKAVFAKPGVVIPVSGEALKIGTIRGLESRGMLCSSRELLLGDDHDGIIELPADAVVGEPAAKALGLNDPVIDVSITPNRGDATSVYGIARDLAAAGLGRLREGDLSPVPGKFKSPITTALDFPAGEEHAAPMFAGRLIRGVKNGPSPQWLQDWLKAVGLRPISALVDVTNFISLDRGRPLHVFDAAKLKGNLRARFAKDGEQLLALDGKTYTLDCEMVVIADDEAARGIGGVMGGEDSSCTDATTDVFVESALFDPIRIARAGRILGILSDARYRFERGVDPEFVRAGPRTRDQDDPEILRRRAERDRRRRQPAELAPRDRVRHRAREAAWRHRCAEDGDRRHPHASRLHGEGRRDADRHAAVLAPRHRRLRRSGGRGRAHPRPRQGAVDPAAASRSRRQSRR